MVCNHGSVGACAPCVPEKILIGWYAITSALLLPLQDGGGGGGGGGGGEVGVGVDLLVFSISEHHSPGEHTLISLLPGTTTTSSSMAHSQYLRGGESFFCAWRFVHNYDMEAISLRLYYPPLSPTRLAKNCQYKQPSLDTRIWYTQS